MVSPANAGNKHKIDLNKLEIHMISKIHSQRNLCAQNSARSDSKSKKRNLRYNKKDSSRNTSMEKEYISSLVANAHSNSTGVLPNKKELLPTKNEPQASSNERIQFRSGGNPEKPTFTSPQVYINGIQSKKPKQK